MSNKQFDQVKSLAQEKNLNLRICPTCRNRYESDDKAPDIEVWPTSTYRLGGEVHDCDCEGQDNLRRHYLLAGIPVNYWTLGEADFFGDAKALAATRDYLDHWVDWKWHGIGLQYYSPIQGTGKTMLATLVARDLIKRGEKVWFIDFRDAIAWSNTEAQEEHTRRLHHTPVLILDEVRDGFTAAQREYFAMQLEGLIRARTQGNAVTIITTNMTPDKLNEEYPRTFSLLASKQEYIHVQGVDARKHNNWDAYHKHLAQTGEARPIL